MDNSPVLRLADFLPYRLSVVSNLVSETIAGAYRALFGLSIPEWRLIAVLAENERLTQQAVGEATRMDKMTVSRAAATLLARGLVVRASNPADARSWLLGLSAAGLTLYAQIAPKALDFEAAVFKGLKPRERDELMAMLARVEAAALAIAPGEPPAPAI